MPNLGPTELIIVLVLVIIIFGVGKLPEVGGALGKSIKEFRKANDDPDEKLKQEETARAEAEQKAREAELEREVRARLEAERAAREKEGARKD
jgi:sec-independent protein translocase protein TatA